MTQLEREHLPIILMSDSALKERIERTPPNRELDFTSAELEFLDDILTIELEHMSDRDHRKTAEQIRDRIARMLSF